MAIHCSARGHVHADVRGRHAVSLSFYSCPRNDEETTGGHCSARGHVHTDVRGRHFGYNETNRIAENHMTTLRLPFTSSGTTSLIQIRTK